MTIHFAAALPPASRIIARCFDPVARQAEANDNEAEALNDVLLRAALKHFARYGLGAAEQAHAEAERAFFKGDSEGYRWWMGICRTLDRRISGRAMPASTSPVEPIRFAVPRTCSEG